MMYAIKACTSGWKTKTMTIIHDIAPALKKETDGIWYSPEEESLSYPADGNDNCFTVEQHSFWFKHRNACITEAVSAFPPGDNGTIFDIGGGNGFVSLALAKAGFDVVLVEPGRVGAANGKKRGLANVICATTQTAQFKDNALSAVGLFDVLEHIEDDQAFLTSIHALLKNDGMLYLTVPAYNFLWSNTDDSAGHFRRYTLKSVSTVLAATGFEVVYTSFIFRFLPLPIFLFRTLPYKLGLCVAQRSGKKTKKEHTAPNAFVAYILNRMLSAEEIKIRSKKSMRFGGSCLLVARKI
jgi:SAM-dependent methyltransferase